MDLKKTHTSTLGTKLLSHLLIIVILGVVSIPYAQFFVENNHHLIEHCHSVEGQSILDEFQKEVDDKIKKVFIDAYTSVNISSNLSLTSVLLPNNRGCDINTPPPEER